MSSFSTRTTSSSSNEKLFNQNEAKLTNQSDKKQLNLLSLNTSSSLNSPNLSSSTKNPLNQFKMSISPSLSSANSNQSSAASSVNSLIDQDDLSNLTNYVKHFREKLGELRRIISNEINRRKDSNSPISKDSSIKELSNKDRELFCSKDLKTDSSIKDLSSRESTSKEPTKELIDKQEMFKAQVHDKLADVLRILKLIFERFVQVQSSDLFICSKNLIESVKGFDYTDSSLNISDLNELLDKIDQLAVCFSNRVSEYLMGGDCVSSAQCTQPKAKPSFDSSATKYVCDSNNNNLNQQQNLTSNLANSAENTEYLWNSVYNMFHKRVFDTSKKEDSNWDNTQAQLSSDECDEIIQRMNAAVEFALQNAKLWSKYIKDITIYIEKRINFEMDNSKNLLKLAQTMKPILKESDNLPLQQLFNCMLELDIKNHKAYFANCSLILGHKFLEPLTVLRNENEKCRKACKCQWTREYKKLQDSVNTLKKARSTFIAKKIELDRAKQALKTVLETGSITSSYNLSSNLNQSTSQTTSSYIQATNFGQQLNHIQMESNSEQVKLDKKRKYEEDALQKSIDAESVYRNAVIDANERARTCENIKKTILNRIKDLDYKSDLTLTSVTGNYLQIQKLVTSAEPVDFQQLLKEVENYSFGSTNLSDYLAKLRDSNQAILNCFTFVPYETTSELNQGSMSFERNSDYESQAESMDLDALNQQQQASSNLDKTSSLNLGCSSNINSSTNSKLLGNLTKHESMITGEELDNETVSASNSSRSIANQSSVNVEQQISKKGYRKTKVAQSHHFRTVRTLSKCKECDVMNFNFQGLECTQCGICVHKKCIPTLTIRCGLKQLPTKRTNIFQLDLCSQSTNNEVPFIVKKCIQEINKRGLSINGLYRVSGVKSQVEKLCSDFEFAGELVDLNAISPTVLTSVLKYYFRSLNEPLLTYRLYNDFIQIGKRYPNIKTELSSTDELELINNSSSQSLLKELRHTCNKLPEVHLNTLDYLMKHLKKVADNPTNNMPANNLGIVFGPTLLRANESIASLSTLVDTVHQNRVIELLIINYNELFGGNLVDDDDANYEFDQIIDDLKTIADEENSEEEDNSELELDNLIQDLNKTELIASSSTRDYRSTPKDTYPTSKDYQTRPQLLSKDSEDCYSSFLKSQNSTERTNELKLSKFAPRPSLQDLRKQFFTETTSTSPFQSFGTSDDLADKQSLNIEENRNLENQKNRNKLEQSSSQPFLSDSRSSSTTKLALIQPSKQSGNQLNQSKSPKSSTFFTKAKDDREPKYV